MRDWLEWKRTIPTGAGLVQISAFDTGRPEGGSLLLRRLLVPKARPRQPRVAASLYLTRRPPRECDNVAARAAQARQANTGLGEAVVEFRVGRYLASVMAGRPIEQRIPAQRNQRFGRLGGLFSWGKRGCRGRVCKGRISSSPRCEPVPAGVSSRGHELLLRPRWELKSGIFEETKSDTTRARQKNSAQDI